jgi:Leucine-rich repeat (LRR) protein
MNSPTFCFLFSVLFFSCLNREPNNIPKTRSSNNDTVYATTTLLLKSNHIPDSIFSMSKLKHISIMGMDCDYGDHTNCWGITEIPKRIKELTELTSLALNVNGITQIPIEITELKKLKMIDLSDNAALTSIDNLVEMKNLEGLYLHGCNLKQLPNNIGNLKNLKDLGLAGNHFDEQEKERIKKALPNCRITF